MVESILPGPIGLLASIGQKKRVRVRLMMTMTPMKNPKRMRSKGTSMKKPRKKRKTNWWMRMVS